jgi:hypothetical protein
VAALAQNGDGLRADQAGAADDDDLHGLASLVNDWRQRNEDSRKIIRAFVGTGKAGGTLRSNAGTRVMFRPSHKR